jgi:hypothetical protein
MDEFRAALVLLAIAFAPTNKIYQQGLTLFLWLPAMVFAWSARERLKEVWRQQRWMCLMVAALAVWGIVSLMWTNTDDPSREAKRCSISACSCCFSRYLPVVGPSRSSA